MKIRTTPFKAAASIPAGTKPPVLQDPGTRAKDLVARHGAGKILRALNDERYLASEFSTYDGMLIVAIGAALRGSGEERERLFNRMFGKVPDKQINLNVNVDVQPDALSARAKELLARLGDVESENLDIDSN